MQCFAEGALYWSDFWTGFGVHRAERHESNSGVPQRWVPTEFLFIDSPFLSSDIRGYAYSRGEVHSCLKSFSYLGI